MPPRAVGNRVFGRRRGILEQFRFARIVFWQRLLKFEFWQRDRIRRRRLLHFRRRLGFIESLRFVHDAIGRFHLRPRHRNSRHVADESHRDRAACAAPQIAGMTNEYRSRSESPRALRASAPRATAVFSDYRLGYRVRCLKRELTFQCVWLSGWVTTLTFWIPAWRSASTTVAQLPKGTVSSQRT